MRLVCCVFEGLPSEHGSLCDVHLPAAQHDQISQDSRPVPSVEQHNARGQLTHTL